MGSPRFLPGQRLPRLQPRHKEMLRLTIHAGVCVSLTPSPYHAHWTVRTGPGGGIEREFSQPTGNWLLDLRLIERTPDSVPVGYRDFSVPFVLRRFEPTVKALKWVERWDREERRAALRTRGRPLWGQQAGAGESALEGAP
jgi:hypothetical protein